MHNFLASLRNIPTKYNILIHLWTHGKKDWCSEEKSQSDYKDVLLLYNQRVYIIGHERRCLLFSVVYMRLPAFAHPIVLMQ